MKYVGIQSQQTTNNIKSILLLLMFPVILLGVVWAFLVLMSLDDSYGETSVDWDTVWELSREAFPWVIGIVAVWFLISYYSNVYMIKKTTGARPLQRRENPRVYNIVENLTMTCGMPMPKINVIDTPELNAFASGIDEKSYTVTLTTGIIDMLDDDELAGVVGHELTHIRNKDTRLLVISIVFVGIISTILYVTIRMIYNVALMSSFGSRRSKDGKNSAGAIIVVLVIAVILSAIAYFFTLLTRFAISRKREYMADAGGAELCGNPLALASALRKISGNPGIGRETSEEVNQLFIMHPAKMASGCLNSLNSMFSTHPKTEDRIAILEQF